MLSNNCIAPLKLTAFSTDVNFWASELECPRASPQLNKCVCMQFQAQGLYQFPTAMVKEHCQWVNETTRERTHYPNSYVVTNKIKLLTLHMHGCLRGLLLLFLVQSIVCPKKMIVLRYMIG